MISKKFVYDQESFQKPLAFAQDFNFISQQESHLEQRENAYIPYLSINSSLLKQQL